MFTFIRLAARGKLPGRPEELKRGLQNPQPDPAASGGERALNPWGREMRRLQAKADKDPNVFLSEPEKHPSGNSFVSPVDEKQQIPGKPEKQGTLTDLKIWWGRSVIPYSIDPGDDGPSPPHPVKRSPRHWWQP